MRARWLGLGLLSLVASCEAEISYGGIHPDLSGRVLIDSVPAAGVTVVATYASGTQQVKTGPDGAYSFTQLPLGSVTLRPEFPLIAFDPTMQVVTLGNGLVQADFVGNSPVAVSGKVLWPYTSNDSMGIANIPIHFQSSIFPVADVTTGGDGSFRFARVPGRGSFPITFGALPAGLIYRDGNQATYRLPRYNGEASTHTAIALYRPSAELNVEVFVDGRFYNGVTVNVNTPMPIRHAPARFINLPVQPLQVSITGYPTSITFDATTKSVQFDTTGLTTVTFTGYTLGANRPPTVTLSAPSNGATFTAGTPITFRGSGFDPEDGNLTGNALDWVAAPGGTLGYGAAITIDTLRVGQHRIVLRGTDSNGSSASVNLDITIVPATGGRVVGSVTVDGSPQPGARMVLSTTPQRFAITDAQGRYAFEDVPAGPNVVSIEAPPCTEFQTTSLLISVAIGARTTANFAGGELEYCYGYGIAPARAVRPPN